VLESLAMGGQAGTSSRIRNFSAFRRASAAESWLKRAFQQAWMFGAEFALINGATGLATEKGDVGHAGRWRPLTAPAAMLATGVSHQQPDALGIAELAGAAVPVAGTGETLAAPAGIGGWIDAGGSVPPPPAKSAAKVPPTCLEQRELP
jgi:thioredoxin reductase (NADPH)